MKKLLLILSIWTFVLNAFASNNVELIDFNGYKAWEEKYSAESDLSVIHSKETAIYNTATKSFDALSLCTGDTKEYIVKLKENKRLQFLSLSSSGTASTQNEKSLKRMLKKYKSHKRIKTKKDMLLPINPYICKNCTHVFLKHFVNQNHNYKNNFSYKTVKACLSFSF